MTKPLRAIIVVLLIMALMLFYMGSRIIPDLPLPETAKILIGSAFFSSLLIIPYAMASRSLRLKHRFEALIWTGLILFGFYSSLFVLTVFRDLALFVCWLIVDEISADARASSASAVGLLSIALTLLGFVNARRTARVVEVNVPITNLPESLDGFRIAQITDIHVGPTIESNYLGAIVERVNALNADVIAITGDLVDGHVRSLGHHTRPLKDLKATHGTYFVTGNHEYYSGAHAWIDFLRELEINVLLNQHVSLEHNDERLIIAGVTDYSAHQFDHAHKSDPHKAISDAPTDASVKVLLAHQPRTAFAALDAGYDLQISGHTHGGQFLPWNFFVRFQQPFTAGLNKMGNMWVYTSRGTGYWGPPKRVGAPSEITLIRLVRA